MRRALLYCTFDGVCNFTNGIGTQAKALLGVMLRRYEPLAERVGPFDFHLAFPRPSGSTLSYDPAHLRWARDVVAARSGRMFPLAHDENRPQYSLATWLELTPAAARVAMELAGEYDEVLVLAADTPFAGMGAALRALRGADRSDRLQLLHRISGSARVRGTTPTDGRAGWEVGCIRHANADPNVWVADIGRFFSSHLREAYGLDPSRLVPFASGLDLASPDLEPMDRAEALAEVRAWGVPLDRPIVLQFGRANPIKGWDLLIRSAGALRDQVHLVLVTPPYPGDEALLESYRAEIAARGVRATHVTQFTRSLPRALSALPETRAVVCASRGEPLSNIPTEVARWALHEGPVVLAPNADGFVEQIVHRRTGLLFDPANPRGLTGAIEEALSLEHYEAAEIRRAAVEDVGRRRDILVNFGDALERLWVGGRTGAAEA